MTRRAGNSFSTAWSCCVTSVLWVLVSRRRFLSSGASMSHSIWTLLYLSSWRSCITSDRSWTCWSFSWGWISDKHPLRICWLQVVLLTFLCSTEKNPCQVDLAWLELGILGQLQFAIISWHPLPPTWKEYVSVFRLFFLSFWDFPRLKGDNNWVLLRQFSLF